MVVILRLRDYSSKIGLPFDSYETLAYVAGIHMDEREFGRHHERIVLPENSGGFREGFHEWIQGCLWNYTASFQHSLSFSEMSIAGHLDRTLFSTETRKLIKDWELKTALEVGWPPNQKTCESFWNRVSRCMTRYPWFYRAITDQASIATILLLAFNSETAGQ